MSSADAASRRHKKKEWSPHFWIGCDAFAWSQLLVRHRFAVHWTKWYVAAAATFVSIFHTAFRLVQSALFGQLVAKTAISKPPVFILGHWRSGTTLLHELLIRDPRHAYPTTYQCLAPHHFILTGSWLPKCLWWMMPSHRPMDNMPMGWDRPQEDEFALCLLGEPSPYERIAFPNQVADTSSLDHRGWNARKLEQWCATFRRFMQQLTYVNRGRRLILKSPPHTARLRTLTELFPDARFIHIVRNPFVLFPSTINLWKSLDVTQGLQKPTFAGLRDYVLDTLPLMYEQFDDARSQLMANRFVEIQYEELIRDPVGHVAEIYRRLELGGFETARPLIEEYVAGTKNYETNRYELPDVDRDAVTHRWGEYARKYGYAKSGGD